MPMPPLPPGVKLFVAHEGLSRCKGLQPPETQKAPGVAERLRTGALEFRTGVPQDEAALHPVVNRICETGVYRLRTWYR
jgi:hypothetical protein